MNLPLHIAKRLQQLLQPGETIASSTMQHSAVKKMLDDGILQKQQLSKTRALLFIPHKEAIAHYLYNHFGISNLAQYINIRERDEQSRASNVVISGNSKLHAVRTFKGFLINSYDAVKATLNGKSFTIDFVPGSYHFIHDYEKFIPDAAVTVVGIENPENFRQIEKQRYLFNHIQPLFVSRYPQSNDLVKWLGAIPNHYLHFGDLDLAGINIYQAEFKKYLGNRASFFVPENTAALIQQFGNRALFNKQYNSTGNYTFKDEVNVQQLLNLILKYKKVLEQEAFIKQ